MDDFGYRQWCELYKWSRQDSLNQNMPLATFAARLLLNDHRQTLAPGKSDLYYFFVTYVFSPYFYGAAFCLFSNYRKTALVSHKMTSSIKIQRVRDQGLTIGLWNPRRHRRQTFEAVVFIRGATGLGRAPKRQYPPPPFHPQPVQSRYCQRAFIIIFWSG